MRTRNEAENSKYTIRAFVAKNHFETRSNPSFASFKLPSSFPALVRVFTKQEVLGTIAKKQTQKKFYNKNKKVFAVIPNLICFLFWFSGTIVYNFLYSKVDITGFKIFALPHLITILFLLSFYFFTKHSSFSADSPPRDSA